MALLPGLPDPDVASQVLRSAVFAYLNSGKLDDAGRASAQAIETAAGLTPHHRLHAAAWQNLLATLTGRWDEVRSRAAEAERAVDANLAAATPCVMNVSVLLNCATASALAGDEDEARRLESKADGIGMEGDRWYHGWFDPPKIRLALARHELGALRRTRGARPGLGVGAGVDLPGRARRARRPRAHRGRGTEVAAPRNVQRAIRAQGPRHCPRRSDAPPAGAGAIPGTWGSPGTRTRPGTCCKAPCFDHQAPIQSPRRPRTSELLFPHSSGERN